MYRMYRDCLPSLAAAIGLLAIIPSALRAEPISFREQIAPLLVKNCQACHGSKKAEGGYRIDTFERLLQPGDSTLAPVTAGDLEDSELLRRLMSDDPDERMPAESDPLPKEQIALVKEWIASGAEFDAGEKAAPLATIIPPPEHPQPPERYRRTLPITALAFSPDGKELLVGGYHEITVWSVEQPKLLRRITNIGQRVYALQLSPDGKTLAAACGAPGSHGEVRLIDLASGEVRQVLASSADVVLDVAFASSGEMLVTGGADRTVRLFRLPQGKPIVAFEGHSDWVMAVAVSPDGKRIASASRDKTVKVFDVEQGAAVATFSDHDAIVHGVAFHPGGEEIFSAGEDKRIRQWKVAGGEQTAEITGFGGTVFKLTVAGKLLVAPSADKTVRTYDLASRKLVRQYGGHADWVLSAALHPDSGLLAAGSFNGEVRIWQTADGKELASFYPLPGYDSPAAK